MNRASAILVLVIGWVLAFCSDAQAQDSDSIYKGKVEMLDSNKPGTMPRITRPPSPNRILSGEAAKDGQTDAQNSELLKAKVFQAAGLGGLKDLNPKKGSFGIYSLSANELNQLSKYDISLLIDSSGSMSRIDCDPLNIFIMEGKVSRWEWCKQQTSILSRQLADVLPAGITVVPFASKAVRFANVAPSAIESIFAESSPVGATRLDAALGLELKSYFAERAAGVRKKPLLIAVITDGVPSFPHLVARQVLDATEKVDPNEIKIVFFLIGDSRTGIAYIDYLCNLRFHHNARYNMVTSHSFSEVSEMGLPRSLVQSILYHGK